ncbi:hypothetical protein AYI68_g1341 [Smittium mucronatum]|uniref:Uncharacterized protein n=1 Tax=Smittium mucronatum TaxID=133383 RepID=A0A1R0H5T0_9FUNG|nr:hypothetical protein AYI68_g1341 [Smittium mucronatum]
MEVITPLLRLSTLRLFFPVLTTLSVCTAPTVEIIGENLTGGLGPELNESPSNRGFTISIFSHLSPSIHLWDKYVRISTGLDQLMVVLNHAHSTI